jgi:hypothetical protein
VYRIVPDDAVFDQVAALPVEALPFYAEALEMLQLVPFNGRPYNEDLPDGPMRELVFGAISQGTITYLILDDQREVHVLLVQWVG